MWHAVHGVDGCCQRQLLCRSNDCCAMSCQAAARAGRRSKTQWCVNEQVMVSSSSSVSALQGMTCVHSCCTHICRHPSTKYGSPSERTGLTSCTVLIVDDCTTPHISTTPVPRSANTSLQRRVYRHVGHHALPTPVPSIAHIPGQLDCRHRHHLATYTYNTPPRSH